MNILADDLPYSVTLAGTEVPISTDYRTGIRFERTLADVSVPEDEKLFSVLRMYYGDGIFPLLADMDTVREALDAVMRFYRCGSDVTAETEPEEGASGKGPAFSYEHDAGYIYAAFMETYGIDLARDRLHWWQFRALFLGLPETVMFCKIMAYRTMEIPAKMSKEKKKFYRRMKRVYGLPEAAGKTDAVKEMEAILAEGGDISHLL